RVPARARRASGKERAEHALVVDDVRERLRPLCTAVRAPASPRVLTTETVHHLPPPIRATLRPGHGLLDAVVALHPSAAVCGVPRAAALAALGGRERLDTGWAAGGGGWGRRRGGGGAGGVGGLGAGGGEVTVALRSALLRGPRALLHAGASIVAGSTWEAELEET